MLTYDYRPPWSAVIAAVLPRAVAILALLWLGFELGRWAVRLALS